MAQNLAKQLIRLRLISLAAEPPAELTFNHAKGRLNITAFVIMLPEPLLIVRIEVIEASPRRIFRIRFRAFFEINIRRGRFARNEFEIIAARIRLVSRDFIQHEVFSRHIHQPFELRTVASVLIRNDATRHDVGLDSAHQVGLEPILFLVLFSRDALIRDFHAAPFDRHPARIGASREAGRVHGKVTLDSLERQTALCDERVQIGREPFGLHMIRERIEMRSAREVSALLGFAPKVTLWSDFVVRGRTLWSN